MTTQPDTRRKLYDRMDDARASYAHENGDGFGDHAWHQADEYIKEGYAIAEQALAQTEEDPQVFIETAANVSEGNSGYLVLCSAQYRLAEIQSERAKKADAFFGVACQITGAA